MEIKYKQPKLKDNLYGEMFWQDWDEDLEKVWFARIDNVPNEEFEVLIETESPLDFIAVRNTHSTYKKLIADLPAIRQKTIDFILANIAEWADNRTERKALRERLNQPFKLYAIKIYYDLSSYIEFAEEDYMNVPIDESRDNFYALIDIKGEFIEAGIED